jgi:hypothetical protein
MKILEYLTRRFKNIRNQAASTGEKVSHVDYTIPRSSSEREIDLLGEDRVKRQRYYEEWACRDNWLVYAEALPLLFEDVPIMEHAGDAAEISKEQRQSAWKHLQRCVKQGLPPVILNPADPPESWRVEPVELYRWAIASRIPIPAELESLLSFICTTVKRDPVAATTIDDNGKEGDAGDYTETQLAREQILDALLFLALRELINLKQVDVEEVRSKLLQQIFDSSPVLFNQSEPPLTRPAVHDLLDRSLEKAITR